MRVLVCGGRTYGERARVFDALGFVHRSYTIHVLIHGGANGADGLAGEWAEARHDLSGDPIKVEVYPARWKTLGPAAGPVRNQKMLDEGHPGLVVAFPGGPGTADMVRRARAAGVPVMELP